MLPCHRICCFRIELSVGVFLLYITLVVLLLVLDKLCEEMHYVGTSLRQSCILYVYTGLSKTLHSIPIQWL